MPEKVGKVHGYLQRYVDEINAEKQKQREEYEEAKQFIQLYVCKDEGVLDLERRELPEKFDFAKAGQEFRLRLDSTLGGVLDACGDTLLEVVEHYSTGLVQLRRVLTRADEHSTLEALGLDHLSTYLVVKERGKYDALVGEDKVPIKVNVLFEGQSTSVVAYQAMTLADFKAVLEQCYKVDRARQFLKLLEDKLALDDDLKTLPELKIHHNTDILLQREAVRDQEKTTNAEENVDPEFVSVLVERDDEFFMVRICK